MPIIEWLEWVFGIADLANKSQAWEAVLRSLGLGLITTVVTSVSVGNIVHRFHRRGTNLAEKGRELAEAERQHAINDRARAERERDEVKAQLKQCQKDYASLETSANRARGELEERLREEREIGLGLKSQLDQCGKEMVATNGPGGRGIWDKRHEDFGVRIILITSKYSVQLNGDLTSLESGKVWKERVIIPPTRPA